MMKNLFNRYLLALLVVFAIGSSNSYAQYCAAGSDECDEFVADVQIGAFSNPSTCGAGGYTDFTALSIDMMQQTDYPFTILNGPPTYAADQCGVWVDWNQDGDFDDADETITVNTNPSPGPYTGIINPPSSALLGQTRMRVRIMWTGIVSSCGNATYGEVEDYTVNVQAAPACLFATGLNTQNLTSSSALVDWNDIATATGGYLVRYKLDSDPATVSTWANPTTTAVSELQLTGLAPTSLYEWQVDADCSGGFSGFTFSGQFFTGCVATDCPVGAIAENETCGADNNGGCNMQAPAYMPLACGETVCGTSWANGGTRDTDWFEFTLTQPSTVTWTVDAEFTSLIGFVNASQGCGAPVFFNLTQSFSECGQAVTTDNLPAGTWWVFVSPNVFGGYACGSGKNRYVATLQCTPLVVATNDDCANAIPLTQNATCVSTAASVDNATISLNGCAGTANDDVWFSFVPTSANVLVDVTGSLGFDAVIEVFDACGGNSLVCTDGTLAGETESAFLQNLTIGNTYFVRVYDFGLGIPATTGFDICVYDAPNIVLMSNATVNACSGSFYDSGFTGNYADSENSTLTILPDIAGNLVNLTFNSFEIEDFWENLAIYDGNSTAAPLIGNYTDVNSPGFVQATNVDGALTLVFTSDASFNFAGWDATIGCISPLQVPNCASNLSPADAATGVSIFTSLSWQSNGGGIATAYDVYFGTSPNPPLVSANQAANSYNPGALTVATTYFWRIIPKNANGDAVGCVDASFTTDPTAFVLQSNNSITTCSANFYDSGNNTANYQDDENSILTINPSNPGALVVVNFTSFDIENFWDNLFVYDGTSTAAPLIGSYTGLVGPGVVTASNVDGALTFEFISDGSFNNSGWEATISCTSPNAAPNCVINPVPADLATGLNNSLVLSWTDGGGIAPTGYDVYFGTTANPPLVSANQVANTYDPGVLAFSTTYFWKVIAKNANGDAVGCAEWSFTTSSTVVYCPAGAVTCDEFIADVAINTLTNPTGCGLTAGYSDYTALSTDLAQGQFYPITVTNGTLDWPDDQCGVWVDWNQDGDFADADETITINNTPGVGPYSGLVDVPATALLGTTRMRVRITFTGLVDPCGITNFGEVEDYVINVIPAPACPYPGGIAILNTTDTSTDIDWNDVATATSYNVRYKLVSDPTTVPTWTTPINTLVSNISLSALIADSQYEVQIEADCGAGSTSGFSPSILFTTLPVPCPNTTCPVGALTENEACGADLNGGCNMTNPAYEPLACGQSFCGTSWANAGTRDTDWFEFTLTQPSTVTWTVDADFTALIGFVDASQGCAAPQFFNLTQSFVECGQAITVDNLAAGTWWVFVSPNVFTGYPCGGGRNNYVANLSCVPLVVADNDDCATAMSLTQNATCVNVTDSVANATQSLTGCAGTANDDVWFSFVATSVNPVIDVQGAGAFDAVIETFDACGGNSLGCVDATAGGGLESALLTGLTIGNTYFFRVYDWNLGIPADNSFTVCVHDLPPPPANDDCANAIMLTQTVSCVATLGSNFLATQSQAGCTGTANDDVWYSFVATTTNPVVELQGIGTYDGVLEVFDACGGNSLACIDATFGGELEIAYLTGLVVGNTYYFRAYDWFNTAGNLTFTVCVHDLPPPPANDDCANAIPITCTTGTITGSTLQANADPGAGLCGTSISAPGIWYSFVGNGQDVTASLCAGTSYDSKINIYSGDCNNLVCEDGNDDFCGAASEVTISTLAGVNYYILVQGFGGDVGNFTLDVFFTPVVPVITSSGPVAFCQGDSVMLMSDVAGVTWSNGVTADNITVLTDGSFSIAYTDASGCSSLSDTTNVMTYALPAVPVIVAAGPTTFCAGGSVALSVTSNDTILWMPGMETTPSIIANASGNYQVMVTDSNGCSSSSLPTAVVVNANPVAPVITANASTNVCEGSTISITSDVAGDLFWSNGENTQTITVGSTSACYDVVFTDVNSCTAVSNQICVSELPAPVPAITPAGNVNICGGGSLNLDVTSADTYMWSTAETTQTITVTTAGSYSCMVTYANGCSVYSDTTVVNFFPAPATPVITPSGATTFCQGGSVTLTSSTADGYTWSSTETTQSIDVLVSGSYVVTTVDANGCSATSQPVTVVVNALPVVNIAANGPTQFCQGGSVTITSSIATGNVWSNGETTSAIVVNTSGNYSTVVTDANNCSATSNVIAITVDTVSTPSISSSGPLSICNGSTVDLTANPGASGFAWSNGATTQTITVNAPGVYFVTITGSNGCSATSPSVTVTAGSASTPFIIVGGPTIICEGESVTLLSSSISGNTWNTGETTESIEVTTTGNYFVTVSDANGCTATSSLVPVIVNPLPTASFTFNANIGGVVTFTNTSTDYVSSQWNFGDNTAWSNNTNPTHTYLADGVYTVTLTVFNDCGSITINQEVTVLGTGVEELPQGQNLTIAPNPSNGQFALTFSSVTNQNVNIRFLNVNGQMVAEDFVGNVSGSVKRTYDYSHLSKGVYMIQIVTNENVITRRIILE